MSAAEKKELRDKGFTIVQTWHIILVLVGMLLSAGIYAGTTANKIVNLENRTEDLETFKKQQELYNGIITQKRDRQFHEIQLNLKQLLKKQGIDYQRVEE
jgi:hypothetical protein